MDLMGSPYLMAHGMGVPVEDAVTVVLFPATGNYRVFVRTYNWTSPWYPGEGPGKFYLLVNGEPVGVACGNQGSTWMWQEVGTVGIAEKSATISLHDLTGFNARCDAILFTLEDLYPPNDLAALDAFRRRHSVLSDEMIEAGNFDFVVVGGGIAGTSAAISAARLGLKVALIQDRPVLGGNNSSEVRVHLGGRINQEPFPILGNVVREIGPSLGGNAQPAGHYEDHKILGVVRAEKNISLFLNHRAFAMEMHGESIRRVLAGQTAFRSPLFADCTGDGTIGFLAGTDFSMGREGKAKFSEETAPDNGDNMTMGSSVQWYSVKDPSSVPFPFLVTE